MADMDIWHKRIGHVNEQRLKSMQSSGIVTSLPKFKVDGMSIWETNKECVSA